MENLVFNAVRVIGATKTQLENFEQTFHPTHNPISKPLSFLTDEQINSVPDQIFNINLSDQDKKHLLLDCFVPYTESHLKECSNPDILLAVFVVVDNQIVYFDTESGDFCTLTEENCKYLK